MLFGIAGLDRIIYNEKPCPFCGCDRLVTELKSNWIENGTPQLSLTCAMCETRVIYWGDDKAAGTEEGYETALKEVLAKWNGRSRTRKSYRRVMRNSA